MTVRPIAALKRAGCGLLVVLAFVVAAPVVLLLSWLIFGWISEATATGQTDRDTYDQIHLGITRDALHNRIGNPKATHDWKPGLGLSCDLYDLKVPTSYIGYVGVFYFCFSGDSLVMKSYDDASNDSVPCGAGEAVDPTYQPLATCP